MASLDSVNAEGDTVNQTVSSHPVTLPRAWSPQSLLWCDIAQTQSHGPRGVDRIFEAS